MTDDDRQVLDLTVPRPVVVDDPPERRDAAQARLRLVLDHTADVILQFGVDGVLQWASPSLTREFGWRVDDVVGSVFDIGADDERAANVAQYEDAVRTGVDAYDSVARVRCADGSLRWAHCRTRLIRDDDGQVVSLVTSMRDVSAQVAAEEALAASEHRYRILAENCQDFVILGSTAGVIEWVSPSVEKSVGWTPAEMVGRPGVEFFDPTATDDVRRSIARAASGTPSFTRRRVRCKDGDYRWFAAHTTPVLDAHGAVTGLVSSWRDITAEVEAEAAAADADVRYRLLAENATDVVLHSGRDGRVAWASPSLTTILGWRAEQVVGGTVADLMHPDDVARMRRVIAETVARGETSGRTEARFRTADGEWRWMSVGGRALIDADGTVIGGIDALRDIQAEYEAREELRALAHRDPLTGLPNRRALLARISTLVGPVARTDTHAAALYVDVDRLKNVNDAHGHAAGDDVIVEVAQRLQTSVSDVDLVARVGGDEFVVLLVDLDDPERAMAVARRIERVLRHPIRVGDHQVVVGASIGVSLVAPDDTVAALLARADAALYAAKLGGRGRIERVDPPR